MTRFVQNELAERALKRMFFAKTYEKVQKQCGMTLKRVKTRKVIPHRKKIYQTPLMARSMSVRSHSAASGRV